MEMKFISGETGIMNQDGVSFLVRSKCKLFNDMKMKSWPGELVTKKQDGESPHCDAKCALLGGCEWVFRKT